MSRSSPSTNSSPVTEQTDSRVALGDGSINSGGGNVFVQSTDYGAVQANQNLGLAAIMSGANTANNGLTAGLDYGSLANSLATALSGLALGSNVATTASAFTAIDGAVGASNAIAQRSFDSVDRSLDSVDRATQLNQNLGLAAIMSGANTANNGMTAGLNYSSQSNSLLTSLAALFLGKDVANTAGNLQLVDSSQARAFSLVDSTVGNSIYEIGNIFSGALGILQSDQAAVSKAYGSAQTSVDAANTSLANAYSDSQGRGAFTDKLLLAAIVGACVIAVTAVQSRH